MKLKYYDNQEFINIENYKRIDFEKFQIFGENLPVNLSGFAIYDDEGRVIVENPKHNILYEHTQNFITYTTDTYIYYVYYLYDENGYVNSIYSAWKDNLTNGVIVKQGQGKEFTNPVPDRPLFDENNIPNFKVVDGTVVEVSEEEKSTLLAERDANKIQVFENVKSIKIQESKILLEQYLATHPLISTCHGGVEAAYNVTAEKQNLMTSHYATYTIEKQLGLNPVLKWNSTGSECQEWTEEEFIQLILEIKAYVEPLVSLQQSYEVQIRNCTNQEELDAISIVYDVYGIDEE